MKRNMSRQDRQRDCDYFFFFSMNFGNLTYANTPEKVYTTPSRKMTVFILFRIVSSSAWKKSWVKKENNNRTACF